MINITILLPTRKRVETLKKSIESLIKTSKHPDKLQFLFAVDDDDIDTINFLKSTSYPNQGVLTFKPMGYENIHKYNNTLALYSHGKWLMFFNDDAIMTTQNWDTKIMDRGSNFRVLRVREQTSHPYAIFPIFPRDWFMLLDHISLHGQNDAWISEIAYSLDIMRDIDIDIIHDRADITGNNNDETFKARKYNEGNPNDPNDLHSERMQNLKVKDIQKIAWYLGKIGQKSEAWELVLAKKRDPFIKLKELFNIYNQKGAIGVGQQNARTDSKTEVERSNHTLSEN
jgi:glycosyltransferase involved in cell wall biosynthesis